MWNRIKSRWERLRRPRWARWSLDLAVFLLLFGAISAWQTRDLVGGGEPMPAFELRDLDGKTWRSEELAGKKVVLTFWAPWCGVCGAQSGNISSLRRSAPEDVEVLSIVLAYDGLEPVKRYVREQEVDYPVLLGDERIARAFRVNTFPTTYFIREDGRIRRSSVGYMTSFGLRWPIWF